MYKFYNISDSNAIYILFKTFGVLGWSQCMKHVRWVEKKALKLHTLSIAYFHSLFVTFLFIGFCLFPVSPDVNLVLFVLDLHMKDTVEEFPLCTYIKRFVVM